MTTKKATLEFPSSGTTIEKARHCVSQCRTWGLKMEIEDAIYAGKQSIVLRFTNKRPLSHRIVITDEGDSRVAFFSTKKRGSYFGGTKVIRIGGPGGGFGGTFAAAISSEISNLVPKGNL